MPNNITTHAFGEKANLSSAITEGKINEFDEVFLTDTDELAYVNSQKEVKYVTPRTQNNVEFIGVTEVGGLKASDFPSGIPAGKSAEDILKMLIQKRIAASYTAPTVSLGNTGTTAGTKEAGTTISPVLNATFNKNDAGDLTQIKIQKNNADIDGATSATSPYAFEPEDFVLGDETITFRAVASYGDGPIKNDNMGTPSPNGQIKAGTVNSSNVSYTGARKSFWGSGVGSVPALTSDVVRGLTGSQLNLGNGTKEVVFEAGTQYIIFAVPATKKLTKVRYNEGNDDGMLPNFDTETVQVADARGGDNGLTNYTVYKYAAAAPSASVMTFVFTVANA